MGSVFKPNKLVRLDRRYAHKGLFTHMVQFTLKNGYFEYHDALKFCYDTWGMSVDAETYARMYHSMIPSPEDFTFSPEWSYLDKYGDHRIYLSDAAAAWLRLSGTWGV